MWGSTYFVIAHYLPAGHPLWGAVFRALPAGLILLAMARKLPRGSWWWRSALLGTLNMGAFFALVYVSGQLLPSSIAAMVMSLSPIMLMLLAWGMLSERPAVPLALGGVVGVAGVMLLVGGGGHINGLGIAASVAALVMTSIGFVLTKKWGRTVGLIASTSWQLLAGTLTLLPLALVVEGGPPPLTWTSAVGFGYITLGATALAYVTWFAALRRLPAGLVGLIGLLNPVTGVLLGLVFGGEVLTSRQVAGLVLVFSGLVIGQLRRAPRVCVE